MKDTSDPSPMKIIPFSCIIGFTRFLFLLLIENSTHMNKAVFRLTYSLILISFLGFNLSCSSPSKEQIIIDNAIIAHGGDIYEKAIISFDFRDRHYKIYKGPWEFEYSREFSDSTGRVKDVLNNEGFTRSINGELVTVEKQKAAAYSRSVNSVAYFAFLPYGLNDPAVIKEYLGESEISGSAYDLIKITFSRGDGGEDFEDEFLYWVNKVNNRIDYLAYSYLTDGGGVRFRKAINPRIINGILIQDYENYMPKEEDTPLDEMETLYKNKELELLSEIILEDVEVVYK
jgi:hypothetical protein